MHHTLCQPNHTTYINQRVEGRGLEEHGRHHTNRFDSARCSMTCQVDGVLEALTPHMRNHRHVASLLRDDSHPTLKELLALGLGELEALAGGTANKRVLDTRVHKPLDDTGNTPIHIKRAILIEGSERCRAQPWKSNVANVSSTQPLKHQPTPTLSATNLSRRTGHSAGHHSLFCFRQTLCYGERRLCNTGEQKQSSGSPAIKISKRVRGFRRLREILRVGRQGALVRCPPHAAHPGLRAIPDSMDPSSTSGGVEQGDASIANTPAVEEAQPAADAAAVVANAGAGGVAAVPATAASGVEESKTAASAKPAATPAVEPVSTVTAVPPEDVLELVASSCRTCVASATHVSVDAAAVSAWVASLSADDARELGDATASGLPLTFETPESAVNFWGTLRWCHWMCVLSPPTLSACRSDGSP